MTAIRPCCSARRSILPKRVLRRQCRGDLPAGGGRRRRRQRDGEGRHDGALRDRRGLRHAQHAGMPSATSQPRRPDHGLDRRVHHYRQGPRRPRRSAAQDDRPDRHRRQIVNALQTIASRPSIRLPPSSSPSPSSMPASPTIHPRTGRTRRTVRALTPEVRDTGEARIRQIADNIAGAYGATVDVWYGRNYP